MVYSFSAIVASIGFTISGASERKRTQHVVETAARCGCGGGRLFFLFFATNSQRGAFREPVLMIQLSRRIVVSRLPGQLRQSGGGRTTPFCK